MNDSTRLRGYVAKLITDDELVINRGARDGVKEGMYFNVLDETTENIRDPETGEDLGSIERIKVQVRVISVSEKISLAAVYPRRTRSGLPTNIDLLMGTRPRSGRLSGETWSDGTQVGDPVVYVTGPLGSTARAALLALVDSASLVDFA